MNNGSDDDRFLGIRLNRYLALCGVTSRRKALVQIQEGRVTVNGEKILEPSVRIIPGRDDVRYDGRLISAPEEWIVLAFNKPPGFITARSDTHGRSTIMDVLGGTGAAVFPVGRLDRDSEGLLLLTNCGDLAHALLHPRYGIQRDYLTVLQWEPSDQDIKKLQEGVSIGPGEWVQPESVKRGGAKTALRIVLTEGKKREVRRMVQAVGHRVIRLVRLSFAGIELGDLPSGKTRPLTPRERKMLEEMTGVDLGPLPWIE
ncbi:MAG: rRNA pseudouridine synthase [Candidatus Eisenbacteria bacterium]|uniref:Pseudouridine synthase n=1 Tax=Eiseniibacteriota bacterium TaxID=2212470 RepID=A0A948RZS2_UNCEI|nr:rRNA pseudouridine synthase [Candidatus Eisenbacteria bacterium]MBU1947161.1 rRNA pseudouridine synthase [Candidatus Eisenbacteria bacterium]MBU2691219.1 rRNA pseudouridine synthase [Candidatus Eisenbacteria bacterium]